MLLHVCCNDVVDGSFMHRAEAIMIGSIELEATGWPPPKFQDAGDHVRLAGKTWPVCASKDWIGNWCWNGYHLGDAKRTQRWWLVDFVKWLRGRGLYAITTGPEAFFLWWHHEKILSDSQLHQAICAARDE